MGDVAEWVDACNRSAASRDWENAFAAFGKVARRPGLLSGEALLPFLEAAYREGLVREGEQACAALLSRPGGLGEAEPLIEDIRAAFLYEVGDFAHAARAANAAVERQRNNPRLWANLGAALIAAGLPDEGRKALGEALALDPNHLRADYLGCLLQTTRTADIFSEDPYGVKYARLVLEAAPPFAGMLDTMDAALLELPHNLWSCTTVPQREGRHFPLRSGIPVIAATWNERGFFLRPGRILGVNSLGHQFQLEMGEAHPYWIQRRRQVRIRPDDLLFAHVKLVNAEMWEVNVQDVSAGGIAFESSEGANLGSAIEVSLEIGGKTVPIPSIVRRCVPQGQGFCVSAEFRMDEATHALLAGEIGRIRKELGG